MFTLLKTLLPSSFGMTLEGDGGAILDVVESGEVSETTNEDSETSKESSTEKTEGTESTGEVEKTQPSDEQEEKDLLTKGDSIPFERFKQFIDKRNTKFSEFKDQLEDMKVEFEESQAVQNDPNVYRAILQRQGITDPKILQTKLEEKGFKVQEEIAEGELMKQFAEGLDLTKQENWFVGMKRMFDHFSKDTIRPLSQRLDSRDVIDRLSSEEPEARKISELFGVKYGNESEDGANLETGVGKLMQYLKDNPRKMNLVKQEHLTKAEALKLALAEKGFSIGKQKGTEEAAKRNDDLKASQMEDSTQTAPAGMPSSDASVHELLDWAAKNPDKI